MMKFHLFGLWFYASKKRMRIRQERDGENDKKEQRRDAFYKRKLPILMGCDFTCAMCGARYPLTRKGKTPRGGIQLHHVLPYKVFPELDMDERNMMPLCAACHTRLHDNPFLMIETMREKGRELGINVEERYENYSNGGCGLESIRYLCKGY
jgi:predicted HNH restriction endonuclease